MFARPQNKTNRGSFLDLGPMRVARPRPAGLVPTFFKGLEV
jgi:hypothetical protein